MSNLLRGNLRSQEEAYSPVPEQASENAEQLEIDLVALCYRLLEKAKYIVAAALVGAVIAGVIAVFFTTPQYTATSKLYVMNSSESAINLSDLQIGTYLTADYVEVFQNWHVHDMVIRELDLSYSYGAIARKLKVTNPSNTRILYISFTSPDPQQAKLIADTYAEKAQEFIASTMDTRMPNLFEEALVPSSPSSRGTRESVILGFLCGMLLACALIAINFLVDDRILNNEDIEKYLGLHVLGIMPVINVRNGTARKTERKEP